MQSAVQHQEQTRMVLLALGKWLHRACCRGNFNMYIHQGYHKMALLTCPAKLFCSCMAYMGMGTASQMTGLLWGVMSGVLDI